MSVSFADVLYRSSLTAPTFCIQCNHSKLSSQHPRKSAGKDEKKVEVEVEVEVKVEVKVEESKRQRKTGRLRLRGRSRLTSERKM
jgi:hypothetical protein